MAGIHEIKRFLKRPVELDDILEQAVLQAKIELSPALLNRFHLRRIPRKITEFNPCVLGEYFHFLRGEIWCIVGDYDLILVNVLLKCSKEMDRHFRVEITLTAVELRLAVFAQRTEQFGRFSLFRNFHDGTLTAFEPAVA